MRCKRGISPLIATVLLVGFVIVLAALAFIFLTEEIEDIIEKVSKDCSESEAAVAKIKVNSCGLSEVTDEEINYYDVAIQNIGQEFVDGVRVRLIDETSGEASSVTNPWRLEAGESGKLPVKNMHGLTVSRAQVMPFLIKGGDLIVCEQNLVEVTCS
jgi:flagellin-like protein